MHTQQGCDVGLNKERQTFNKKLIAQTTVSSPTVQWPCTAPSLTLKVECSLFFFLDKHQVFSS